MSTQVRWTFQPADPMGGATGTAFVNPLSGTVKSGEETLARESIQNSCDAGIPGEKVRLVFRIEKLEGKERDQFVKALQLQEGIKPRLASLGLPKKNCLKESGAPLYVTYVEDYGTQGLGGDPHHRESNFFKLLLALGDPSKATAQKESGGSYGYGKAALTMNSRLHTVVAYSAYKKDEMNTTARLMGCGYFHPHDYKAEEYSGRAWFGLQGKDRVSPVHDAEAHAMAGQLGFTPRGPGKTGTSLLIVDSSLDPVALLRCIEDWWWPRIVDQQVVIEVQVEGKPDFPKPKARKDLAPFIECYSLAQGTEPTGKDQRRDEFNKLSGLELGSAGFRTVGPDAEKAITDVDEDRLNSVALIRSPRMAVEYLRVGKPTPVAVGVFVAHGDIDKILKLSEPPAHDHWTEDSPRLGEAEPDEETARLVVRKVKSRIKERLRAFQAQAEPPRDQQPRHLTVLERELGALLKLGIGQGRGDGRQVAPVEVEYRSEPTREFVGKQVRSKTSFALVAKPDAKGAHVKAILRATAAILEDEDGSSGDHLPVTVRFSKKDAELIEEVQDQDGETHYKVKVPKDRPIEVSIVTAEYDPEWSTKFNVALEEPEA